MKLSVVMPCFNEERTVRAIVARVLAQPLDLELVVVDDGSTDGTIAILHELAKADPRIRLFFQPKNMGKGAALRRGFEESLGQIVVVQDADLEYDPDELQTLIEPIVAGRADVVFGSRFLGGPHRVLYFWHSIGNAILTTLSNVVSDLNLTDMETCYKAFRREVIQSIDLEEDRFGFEPEVTVKLARIPKLRIYEVSISYSGRTYAEGKKVGMRDGFRAVYVIGKYGLWRRLMPKRR